MKLWCLLFLIAIPAEAATLRFVLVNSWNHGKGGKALSSEHDATKLIQGAIARAGCQYSSLRCTKQPPIGFQVRDRFFCSAESSNCREVFYVYPKKGSGAYPNCTKGSQLVDIRDAGISTENLESTSEICRMARPAPRVPSGGSDTQSSYRAD